MAMKPLPTSAIVFYEGVLKNGRKSRLPPDQPQPAPPSCWPPENRALLEQYYAWLIADGAGRSCITTYYLPMAGHVYNEPQKLDHRIRWISSKISHLCGGQFDDKKTNAIQYAVQVSSCPGSG